MRTTLPGAAASRVPTASPVPEWTKLQSGAPVLQGALANIDCLLDEAIIRHSHAIVLGRIVALRSNVNARPLVYWQRSFLGLEDVVRR